MSFNKVTSLKVCTLLLLLLSGCTSKDRGDCVKAKDNLKEQLSVLRSNLKSDSAKKIIDEASEDFDLVVVGKNPKNAKLINGSLNGVNNFKGNGYALQVIDSDGTIAGNYINIYGPIVEFDSPEFQLLAKKISDVRFYDHSKYLILKGKK